MSGYDNLEKPSSPTKTRFAFLKTKRAIVLIALLVITAGVLIGLGASGVLTPNNSNAKAVTSPHEGNVGAGNAQSTGGASDSDNKNNNNNDDDKNNKTDTIDKDEEVDKEEPETDVDTGFDGSNGTTTTPETWKPKNSSTIADGVPLRIMCLGASLVRGELSHDNNGFRSYLRSDLTAMGAQVNMVGSQRFGDMLDNDQEAYGGNRVRQIHEHAKKIVKTLRPNVFVVNVGTNNVLQERDVDVAGQHMEAFLDYLLEASPRATVILSTLLTNTVPNREPMVLDLNAQFRDLYNRKYRNRAVVLAELHPSEGIEGVPQVQHISDDGSHPTDQGYEIMGHLLADAVKVADSKGYLRWPDDNGLAYDGDEGRGDPDNTTQELPPKKTKAATAASATIPNVAANTTPATTKTTATPNPESINSRIKRNRQDSI